jgi:hypothetical protein
VWKDAEAILGNERIANATPWDLSRRGQARNR